MPVSNVCGGKMDLLDLAIPAWCAWAALIAIVAAFILAVALKREDDEDD